MSDLEKEAGLRKLRAYPRSKKRIKDRGISWKEGYPGKSAGFKKRFDKKIGHGAYMRWEGHDYSTNGDYFVIVGPSLTKEGKKQFFAGIKRLPDDPKKKVYAPSGKYFANNQAAFSHASAKWGVPFPRDIPNYGINDLMNVKIARHVKGSENMKIIKSANYIKLADDMGRTRSIPQNIKNKMNNEIHALGNYHQSIPLQQIFDIMKKYNYHPLQEDGTPWSGILAGGAECGSDETRNQVSHFTLATQENGQYNEVSSVLSLSWCKMPSGKTEIICYVS